MTIVLKNTRNYIGMVVVSLLSPYCRFQKESIVRKERNIH